LLSEVQAVIDPARKEDDKAYQEAFDQIVTEKLLLAECKRSGLTATSEEIDQAIKNVRSQRGWSEEAMRQALASAGLNEERYRHQMSKELCKMKIMQSKVRSRVQVSKQDVLDAYQRHYPKNKKNVQYELEDLRFTPTGDSSKERESAKQVALEAKRTIAESKFKEVGAQIAKKSKQAELLSLGIVTKDSLLPAMEDALSGAKKGDTVGPIFANDAWHILHVNHVKEIPLKSFDDVEKELHAQIYEDRIERAFRSFVDELRSQTDTQNFGK
jgi:peptidyl-prolyl cis-trans isomerase SurA